MVLIQAVDGWIRLDAEDIVGEELEPAPEFSMLLKVEEPTRSSVKIMSLKAMLFTGRGAKLVLLSCGAWRRFKSIGLTGDKSLKKQRAALSFTVSFLREQ